MTTRKRKTGSEIHNPSDRPMAKGKELMAEAINKDKLAEFRRMLIKCEAPDSTFSENVEVAVELLSDKEEEVRWKAAWALEYAAEKNHETRITITKALMDLTNSHEFMIEAERNSDAFIDAIKGIYRVAQRIDRLERKSAYLSP